MFKIDLYDSLDFVMDKQAHLYVSFGLYYFFYTHTVNIILSLSLAFLIGFLYELVQGFTNGMVDIMNDFSVCSHCDGDRISICEPCLDDMEENN